MKLDVKRLLTIRLRQLFLYEYIYFNFNFLIEVIILLMKFQEVLQHLYFKAFLKKQRIFQHPCLNI